MPATKKKPAKGGAPKVKKNPPRSAVRAGDTWNLAPLYASDAAWEKAYKDLEKRVPGFAKFKGKLGKSADTLRQCCEYDIAFDRVAEKVAAYAYLKSSENVANSTYQGMVARYTYVATRAGEAASFVAPEIQAIPKARMAQFLKDKKLAPFRVQLERLLRYKPHILSLAEERVLAMQGEVAESASKVFGQLNDADLKFGTVTNDDGVEVELTHASLRALMESPKRAVRKQAFDQFYKQYEGHANTFAATLSSSVLQDVYHARVRNHKSARAAALFGDNVPVQVYDSLIDAVHKNLDTVYAYLDLRKRVLKLKEIRAYDSYAPLVKTAKVHIPYEAAVESICAATAPLGEEYVGVMRKGLLQDRWVDRYENQGKRSGAYSYGTYDAPPYILMNYQDDVIDSMFTLAHEAGHSMHTHYSAKAQPYQYSHYTIFVAEVASTFNEQLLGHYLLERVEDKNERASLIVKAIDEIRGTIIRQTMFAEYEKIIHAIAEEGQPLTVEVLRAEYRKLIGLYFGKGFTIDAALDLEGLRIPHFYSAFYVYKYATGLSAAIALADAVRKGGATGRERYLNFLRSGNSKFPLDLLKDAGVDLRTPKPVAQVMAHFKGLVKELDRLL